MRLLILNQYGLPRGAAGITRHGDIGADYLTRRLVATPVKERRKIGKRGRHLVRARYSIEAVTDGYKQVLRDVVAEHGR